jgi:hypothetical protein
VQTLVCHLEYDVNSMLTRRSYSNNCRCQPSPERSSKLPTGGRIYIVRFTLVSFGIMLSSFSASNLMPTFCMPIRSVGMGMEIQCLHLLESHPKLLQASLFQQSPVSRFPRYASDCTYIYVGLNGQPGTGIVSLTLALNTDLY